MNNNDKNNNKNNMTITQTLIASIVIGFVTALILAFAHFVADGYNINTSMMYKNDYIVYIPVIAFFTTIIAYIVLIVINKQTLQAIQEDPDFEKLLFGQKKIAYNRKDYIKKAFIQFIYLTVVFLFIFFISSEGKEIDITKVLITALVLTVISTISQWNNQNYERIKNKKFLKEKLSENDFNNDKTYYRDILNEYTPAELSYIDDFIIDYPKDIVVTLLNLKHKGKIVFDESNNKIIITKKDVKLTHSEIHLLNNIIFGKVSKYIKNSFLEEIQIDTLNKNLIRKNHKTLADYLLKPIAIFILIIIAAFIIFNSLSFENTDNFTIYLIGSGIIFIVFGILPRVVSSVYDYAKINAKNPYVRTELGEEINKKLEGLKNYLKDFSNLDESKTKDLVIWEEYLIYSVLFNQNTDILNEMYNRYFEIEKDFYND